ncbi:MAG TPA: RNA-binding S4 domain-containing protein [Candidatus Obscuribacterales bacterium]
MRIDKFLKLSRLIKRRTIAQLACEQGRVFVNDRIAKPGHVVKVGDKVHIELGSRALTVEIASVPQRAPSVQEASSLYTVLEEIRRPPERPDWLPEGEELD